MKSAKEREQETLAMDILTGSMYSLNFLRNLTTAIFDPKLQLLTVREVYDQWLKKAGFTGSPREPSVPYNFGPIIGFLYCGILLAKEKWFDLLPEVPVDESAPEWGLRTSNFSCPKTPSPSIKYILRRMRNALGHGNIEISFPKDAQKDNHDKYDFEKRMILHLHDVDPRNPDDTFDIQISLLELSIAIKKFHSIAYPKIISKGSEI